MEIVVGKNIPTSLPMLLTGLNYLVEWRALYRHIQCPLSGGPFALVYFRFGSEAAVGEHRLWVETGSHFCADEETSRLNGCTDTNTIAYRSPWVQSPPVEFRVTKFPNLTLQWFRKSMWRQTKTWKFKT